MKYTVIVTGNAIFETKEGRHENMIEQAGLKLPRLVSDGMVLQYGKKTRIWGWDTPGREITVSFLGKEKKGIAGEDGLWQIELEACKAGGPYVMEFKDDHGDKAVVRNILVGSVWFCSGQSNMELPMERVKDRYPNEIRNCENFCIRTFKITENAVFSAPLEELATGEWKQAHPDTILQFSATAYFFAKTLYEMTGIPVGLINASLGGSGIESWMGREMLAGYDAMLEKADQYADREFVAKVLKQNEEQAVRWHEALDNKDLGLKECWQQEKIDTALWKTVHLPFFFRDTELADFIGSVWLRRRFTVPANMAGKPARLWLGTIVDSDTAYINGVQVGHTDYQYPPRKYQVPEGLLREGENTIVIHVKCERGKGRFTPGKKYALWNDTCEIDLQGDWLYRVGAGCDPSPETDFVNWKPTGLYNGMTAPCHRYAIEGILWYQGESNTHEPEVYLDLMERMIEGYRQRWQEELPFFYVQLPNFAINIYDSDTDETGSGWPRVRELQRQALKIPNTGMVTAIDLGEDNDLHPLNKKDLGFRLALLAAVRVFDQQRECSGPTVIGVERISGQEICLCLKLDHSQGLCARSPKGEQILDFELEGKDGTLYPAKAMIREENLILTGPMPREGLRAIRYLYANTNKGALLYNRAGLPMSPVVLILQEKESGYEISVQ